MEHPTNIAIGFAINFLIMVIHPEWQKSAAAVRKALKSFFNKPLESFMFISLCIILAGVIKLAFLQG